MLSFSDLSDRYAQLRQVVGRLSVKTLVYHPAELVRDPICHIEPVQLSVKELCQTAVVLPCAAQNDVQDIYISIKTPLRCRSSTRSGSHSITTSTSTLKFYTSDVLSATNQQRLSIYLTTSLLLSSCQCSEQAHLDNNNNCNTNATK